mmetsp:Transcript_24036/g.36044  ORF Transcript_24036/g.36044 Transcript_24036/m.36044 type:complete len:169 (-) Transcript_24036:121-627(-)
MSFMGVDLWEAFCKCDKGVLPNLNARARGKTLHALLALQVLFGISRIITGFAGMRGIVLGALGFVAISSDNRYLITLVLWHSLLSGVAVLDEISKVISVYLYPYSPIADLNRKSQTFHAQTACVYILTAYISALLYLDLRQCRSTFQASSGVYNALSDTAPDEDEKNK